MKSLNILISGAGVAGPALAYWLHRFGFNPTIVERAPAIRTGGQAVDFRGSAHLGVLRRMGLLDEVRALHTNMGAVSFVDAFGSPLATMSPELASGDIEILRGDLTGVLHKATCQTAEYIFGDSITALSQDDDGVEVAFERSGTRRFDLVIGADGLHSRVRALTFGDEARFVRHLGYYVAIFTVPNDFGLDHAGQIHCVPGKAVGVYSTPDSAEARAIFYFASPQLADVQHDLDRQKQILADIFADVGWHAPALLTATAAAPDFYFDSISQVRMDAWSNGRVALVGDAGYGGTIGGMGTGLAVVCAYVLAGELAISGGDYQSAFRQYASRIGAYARGCQKTAETVGPFMAPGSSTGIWLRNHALKALAYLPGRGMMERIAMKRASAIDLPDYANILKRNASFSTTERTTD